MILQFLANGIASGSLYAIVALGFGLIYNSTEIFHFAHGAVYVATAYIFYLFLVILKLDPVLAFAISIIFGGSIGILFELIVYRPLDKRKASMSAMMISSFGLYLFTVNLIALLSGNETKILSPGIEETFIIGPVILTRIQIISIISFLIVSIFFFIFRHLKYGRIILAFSNNPKLTEVLGWSPYKIRVLVFGFGSILAGVSACLSGLDTGIDPNIGMSALLVSAVSVIIGGVKIFEGAILGGILLGLLQSLVVWQFSARWMDFFTFVILILFLLLRPQGLLGKKIRLEEER